MTQHYEFKRSSFWAGLLGVVILLFSGLTVTQTAQAQEAKTLWTIDAPYSNWFGTGNNVRGMTYNPATGHLIVGSRDGGLKPVIVDAATGDSVGMLSTKSVKFSENFESISASGDTLAGWEFTNAQTWLLSGYGHNSDKYAGWGESNNSDHSIRSPKITNPGVLSFYIAAYNNSVDTKVTVEISEDGSAWTPLDTLTSLGAGGDFGVTFISKTVPINKTGDYYIRWSTLDHVNGGFYLDDIEVYTPISGGIFPFNQFRATADGQIFTSNLVLDGKNVKIYRWADEDADPELVFSGNMTNGVRFGDSFGAFGEADEVYLALSGNNPGIIATFLWDGEALTPVDELEVSKNVGRGGFSTNSLGTIVLASGTFATPRLIDLEDGAEYDSLVINGVATEDLQSVMYVDFVETRDGTLVITGPAFTNGKFYFATEGDEGYDLISEIGPLGNNTNGNNTGATIFDEEGKRLFLMDSNNQIHALDISEFFPNPADDIETLWTVDAPESNWFGTGNNVRSMTYNPLTDHVIVASRDGGLKAVILDAATGDSVGMLSTTGISGGIFPMNQFRATADGQIFTANLVLDGKNVKVYRWADESSEPELVFTGDMTNGVRFGDALGAFGSGSDVTLLLSGSNSGVIAKLVWDGESMTLSDEFIVSKNVGRGGYSTWADDEVLDGEVAVMAAGTNASPRLLGLTTGAEGDSVIINGVETADLQSVMYIDAIDADEDFYIITGPAFTNGKFYLAAFSEFGDAGLEFDLVKEIGPLGNNTNGNNTGATIVDKRGKRLFLMDTNNQIHALDISSLFPDADEDGVYWSVDAPFSNWFGTANNVRGMTYNPVTDHVIVASRDGGLKPVILDAFYGDSVGILSTTGISGGTFPMNQIRATADGQIFTANLVLDGKNVKIYRWADESAEPEVVFTGDMTNGVRFGDALGAFGTGDNVTLLLSGSNSGVVAKFLWDGETLTKDDEWAVTQNVGRGGFSYTVTAENQVMAAGTNAAPRFLDLDDGTEGEPLVIDGVEDKDLASVMFIDFATSGGETYVVAGPAFTNGMFYVAKSSGSGFSLVSEIEPLGINSNGNNTGAVIIDKIGKRLFLMDTNNKIVSMEFDFDGMATSIDENTPELASEYRLEQNYPNPFNPTTTIRFNLQSRTDVTLKIYNMLGQEVATLINRQSMSQGAHLVNFDATGLSSGVYLYRLVAGDFVSQKMMTLIK
jgi:hypothetical protein